MKLDAPRNWPDEPYDSPVFETALEYIRIQHPRVLFLSLGETDEWAHAGNYGEYLLAAHRADSYLQRLWTALQSMPEYRGNTAIIFANDHGRGKRPRHLERPNGEKIPESKNIFIALAGPGVPNRGVLSNVPAVTQSQVAATLAQLVGRKLESGGTQRRHASPTAAVTGGTALAHTQGRGPAAVSASGGYVRGHTINPQGASS